jgi:carbamoyltransferase
MATILGVSANYHDAAAALVIDGRVVAAQQEERLSRVKNDPAIPREAMRACLKIGGVDARALDAVVFYENPYAKLERVLVSAFRSFPRAWRQFPRATASQLGHKVWVLDHLAHALSIPRDKVVFREHHEAHAASAFFVSPFEEAAVLTVDGVGEEISTAIWHGEGRTLRCIDHIAFPHSLGLLYAALTAYLGFEVNEGEYKVMGLAAFGEATRSLEELVTLHGDGTFSLSLDFFDAHTDTELGFGKKLEALLGPRRPPGRRWSFDSDRLSGDDKHYADIAASLQAVTERALLGLVARAKRLTGCTRLCLAGGVALNAVANARLAREVEGLFVQPAAGDAGGALGAAILASLDAGDPTPACMTHAALGVCMDAAEAFALAEQLGLAPRRIDDPATFGAELLARGEIVAWATGACEWGPRALGQRSLVALPGPAAVRERLNRVIKRREPFRPFAPSALADDAAGAFAHVDPALAPFMVTTTSVLAREGLEAVTHIDGTARLHVADDAPGFSRLLAEVKRATGKGVVLNTSLNGKSEPILGRAADALAFFMAHPVDSMLIDDVYLTKGGRR